MCGQYRGGRLTAMEQTSDARATFDQQIPTPVIPQRPIPAPATGFRLHRSRSERMLGGVCGGLAESLDVDASLLRIGLVALTLLGAGIGVVLYIAAWILVPEADPA
jgi:phage shock protein C